MLRNERARIKFYKRSFLEEHAEGSVVVGGKHYSETDLETRTIGIFFRFEENEANDVFELLENTLGLIEAGKHPEDTIVFYFEINLLRLLGYKPKKAPAEFFNLEKLTPAVVEKNNHVIKAYIYEYLADRFNSLEIQ